jgi:hypothetical protein
MKLPPSATWKWFLMFTFSICFFHCQQVQERHMASKSIEEVLKENTDHLMKIPGVVGTGIGEYEGKPCIKVLVVKKTPVLQNQIPMMLETWRVVIEETGEVKVF